LFSVKLEQIFVNSVKNKHTKHLHRYSNV